VWQAYRELCSREKLRPSLPVEEFLKLVLENGSASSLLNAMRGTVKARTEGFEAYARVLLDWYMHGKFWFPVVGDDNAPVEALLLDALKGVADPELRRRIEEALVAQQRRRYLEKRGVSAVEKTSVEEPKINGDTGKTEDAKAEELKRQMQKELNELKNKDIGL
jgi:hypothetical protein